jgi:hypothetical protein
MSVVSTVVNKDWIVAEFIKLADAERWMAGGTGPNPKTPPDETLSCVYHEMSAADERHCQALKTIAARYGYVPVRTEGGGIGEALGRLKDKFSSLGSDSIERLVADISAKAEAIHRYTAWVNVFESMGDSVSGEELTAIVADEQLHLETLHSALTRLIEKAACGI